MTREQLITSKEYVVGKFQLGLLNLIEGYMQKKEINRKELSDELSVSKGYVSQLLNVSYDHKISKLVELALSCNYMPVLNFVELNTYVDNDQKDRVYELVSVERDRDIQYNTITSSNENDINWTMDTKITPVIQMYNYKTFKVNG